MASNSWSVCKVWLTSPGCRRTFLTFMPPLPSELELQASSRFSTFDPGHGRSLNEQFLTELALNEHWGKATPNFWLFTILSICETSKIKFLRKRGRRSFIGVFTLHWEWEEEWWESLPIYSTVLAIRDHRDRNNHWWFLQLSSKLCTLQQGKLLMLIMK